MNNYLKSSYFFDYTADPIQNLVSDFRNPSISDKAKAIDLYSKIRDQWTYDPYTISFHKEHFRASYIAVKPNGNCVEKSILLIACLRALNLPARLHLGKVKNHIAVERLTQKFGSNELAPHGMVNVHLNGKWLKLSPAFNADLCNKFCVAPLEFDGESDSFLQPFNSEGHLFMEYTADYGHFEDVPLEFMKTILKEHYPHIFNKDSDQMEFKL